MTHESQRRFGAGVVEAAEADATMHGQLGSTVLKYVVMALFGTGFMTCGIVEMFTAK